MDFDLLLAELQNRSGLKKDDILYLVDKRYSEMNNLITKEGAIYLVAKELGIDLPENTIEKTPIKNITPGMRNVNIIGRVFKISKTNEFIKLDGTVGRVVNIYIGDNTGFVRVPLWDEQIKLLEESISLGDIVQISHGVARENIFGDIEISLGRFGRIIPVEYTNLPSLEELSKMFLNVFPERSDIVNIVSGGNFEIKGTIVQLFKGNFLFDICPLCDGRLDNSKCFEHGEVTPNQALVLSFIIDDGTGDLRCVLFREIAEKICGIKSRELSSIEPGERYQMLADRLLGKEFILSGKVRKNKLFDRLEMVVNDFKDINPLEESKRLVNELESVVNMNAL
ncbi:MAG: OB-fold nucleic acid binding domain-containing protein [Candidatus Aenigmatarchaeota archaeon]